MFTKAQLIERGSHYFDDPKISKMYATTDGNFFHENAKNYADSHAKSLKTQVIEITKGDLKEKPKAEPKKSVELPEESNSIPSPSSFEELKAEAKKLNIKGWAIMKEETLKRKIEEENGTS